MQRDANPTLGLLHWVDVSDVADVLEVHASSILNLEDLMMEAACTSEMSAALLTLQHFSIRYM
jgi:hypothetical protein